MAVAISISRAIPMTMPTADLRTRLLKYAVCVPFGKRVFVVYLEISTALVGPSWRSLV